MRELTSSCQKSKATLVNPSALVDDWRAEFPAIQFDSTFTYLDNAATTHRPRAVLDAVVDFYCNHNANPGNGPHRLAEDAYVRYEAARARIAKLLGADDPLEIVFTRGTTEAINLVARAWAEPNLRAGDEILITAAEHYSNFLPWQAVTERQGAMLRFLEVDENGDLQLSELERAVNPKTKLVCVAHVSNVIGIVNPVRQIVQRARAVGATILVDGAQSAPHLQVDVRELGCDFFAVSGHKLMGPMGSGALWARRELLEEMLPFEVGARMAHSVTRNKAKYAPGALKFEAGTPNVADAVGFAAAAEFLEGRVGWKAFRMHEYAIASYLLERLTAMKTLRVIGPRTAGNVNQPPHKIPLVTFTVPGFAALELVGALDRAGFGVRGGDLAALPLLSVFGLDEAVRVSTYLYTTRKEIDQFADALESILRGHSS